MFHQEGCRGQPCRDYPRIGPTVCTKWFGPSISPGPILPPWTGSQPYRIDSGGNIFLNKGDAGATCSTSDSAPLATLAACAGPSLHGYEYNKSADNCPPEQCEESSSSWRRKPTDALGVHTRRGEASRLETSGGSSSGSIKCGGGVLHHAGGILRCRSAGTISRSSPEDYFGGGDDRRPSIENMRPTLRAYSAPRFLHSALFPPKRRASSRGRNVKKKGSDLHPATAVADVIDPACSWDRAHSSDGGWWRDGEEPLQGAGEISAAFCCQRHRRRGRGYLHRFMGFEQEKVSCPPVAVFRVIGGLGEFPRRKVKACDAACSGAQTQCKIRKSFNNKAAACRAADPRGECLGSPRGSAEVDSLPKRSGRGQAGVETSDTHHFPGNTPPGSLVVEHPSWQTSSKEEEGGAPTAPVSSYPLELFAEGSNVAPPRSPSPPLPEDGMVAATTPVRWGSSNIRNSVTAMDTTNRPKAAKRHKAGGTGARRKRSASTPSGTAQGRRTTTTTAAMATRTRYRHGERRTSDGRVRRFGGAAGTRTPPYGPEDSRFSTYLPYSLERPVSPQRSQGFFYTSN